MTQTISSCKQCAHGFKWDTDNHDNIPDKCPDCRTGNPPTIYHD